MSKKSKIPPQQIPASASNAQLPADGTVRNQPAAARQDAPAADASKKYFFIFWGIIILAAAAAWILAAILPGTSESVIERWLMAAMAASLAVFLLVYK